MTSRIPPLLTSLHCHGRPGPPMRAGSRLRVGVALRGCIHESPLLLTTPGASFTVACAQWVNAVRALVYHSLQRLGRSPMSMWKSITLSAGLLAVATGFAAAVSVTVRSDVDLRAGPGANFSAIGHLPGGTELETTDCAGGWCRVEFKGIAGFLGAADLGNDAAIQSSSARREETRQRSRTRVTRRSAHATRSAPGGEDADLFVLPAQTSSTTPSTRR
jgi:hypothetical protein